MASCSVTSGKALSWYVKPTVILSPTMLINSYNSLSGFSLSSSNTCKPAQCAAGFFYSSSGCSSCKYTFHSSLKIIINCNLFR